MLRDHSFIRMTFVAIAVTIVLLAWHYQQRLATQTREETREILTSLLNTSVEAVRGWIFQSENLANHVAGDARLHSLAVVLATTDSPDDWRDVPEQRLLKQRISELPWAEITEFQLIGPDNRVLAASDPHLIGRDVGSRVFATFLAEVRGGEHAFLVNSSIDRQTELRGLYSYSTVADTGTVLALRMRRSAPLLQLLTAARPGRTGETYLFDRQGMVLTDLRFHDQLHAIGLLPQDQEMALNLHLRDPGVDLTDGAPVPPDLNTRPLTRMAASATRGESGIDLGGYRDYRGVMVVGAWNWLDEYGLGIAVEMDRDEAFAQTRAGTLVIMGFAACLLLLVLLLYVTLSTLHRLRGQHRLVDSIVEALPGMFFMLNADGEAERWNRAAMEAMGDPPETGHPLPLEFWVRDGDKARVREQTRLALREGRASFEAEFESRDRQPNPCYVHVVRVDIEDATHLLVIALGITELKRTQQDLAEARARAEAASDAKSRFLANMSHEIRTPLNGVIGMLELMSRSPKDDSMRSYLEICQASADLLLQVISDILSISEIEAGKLELSLSPLALEPMLENVLSAVTPQAREKSLQLSCNIEPEVPSQLTGDAGRLSQVLLNLVGNAVKFTHEGAVGVTVRIAERQGDRICLEFEVSDTGIGIPRTHQEAIFEPFEQQDSSTSRAYGGSGLGLAISKSLVELMGGSLSVDSEPGMGSTFRFTAWFEMERA